MNTHTHTQAKWYNLEATQQTQNVIIPDLLLFPQKQIFRKVESGQHGMIFNEPKKKDVRKITMKVCYMFMYPPGIERINHNNHKMDVWDHHSVDAPFVGWCCVKTSPTNGTTIISQNSVIPHFQVFKQKKGQAFLSAPAILWHAPGVGSALRKLYSWPFRLFAGRLHFAVRFDSSHRRWSKFDLRRFFSPMAASWAPSWSL